MHRSDSYPGESRISFSSILLLVIFVSAAALIVTAILWRPWFGDSSPSSQAAQLQPTATVAAGAQSPAASSDPNAPNGP